MRLSLLSISTLLPFSWPALAAPKENLYRQNATCLINNSPDVSDLAGVDYVANVKSVRVANNRNYRFVFYKAAEQKPYVLLLHGFPSTSYDWRRQFDFLRSKGYGVVAPDLLGYGGTDKPTDLEAYRLKPMAAELISLLDCLQITHVVNLGHDWGSLLSSRLSTYYPERFMATVFLDIGYFAPPLGLSRSTVSSINSAAEFTLGYPIFQYMLFFNQPDAASIMNAHPRSASSLIYSDDPKLQSRDFCNATALHEWLLANRTAPQPTPWLPLKELETFERITAQNGGYAGGLNWYKAIVGGLNKADENDDAYWKSWQLKVPVLLITADLDPIGLPTFARAMTSPYAWNLTEKSVNASHFLQVQQSEGVNTYLGDFLDGLG